MWGILGATVASIAAAFVVLRPEGAPPPVYGTMPDFSLQDQNGRAMGLSDLKGKVWIADVIFTRCAGECPIMSSHLKKIEEILPAELPIRFVTFTTDANYDTPAVMKKYAERYGADTSRWSFLTGGKTALRAVIYNGLKLTAMDKAAAEAENPNDLFVHSAKFVLIDGSGRIRGYFDGEQEAAIAETSQAARRLAEK